MELYHKKRKEESEQKTKFVIKKTLRFLGESWLAKIIQPNRNYSALGASAAGASALGASAAGAAGAAAGAG